MQIGQKIIRLEAVDSTNNYAANLQKEGLISHGAVILADEQTSGRGQRGSVWHSKPGENLLVSFLLIHDNLSVKDQASLHHYISVCVVEYLAKIGISVEIKWPNDLIVKGKKIGGILIENAFSGLNVTSSIVGLGLNVNQKSFEGLNATSVYNETGSFSSKEDILFGLILIMNQKWSFLQYGNFDELKEMYLSKLYLLNSEALFRDSEGEFVGMIVGTTELGKLIVQKGDIQQEYDLKEISIVNQNVL